MNAKLKIVFSVLVGLILIGGVGTWYAASSLDPAQLAKLLSSSVKTATGRDLKISGPITLHLFPRISVSAEQLSLSNASWANNSEMLTLKRIEIGIKTLPLLSKRVEISSIKLNGLELFLQKNVSGQVNWDLSEQNPNKSSVDGMSNRSPAGSPANKGLIFTENVAMSDVQIHYQEAQNRSSNYEVEKLSLTENGNASSLALKMKYQALPIEVAGKIGSLSQLFQQWDVSPITFAIDLTIGINGKSALIQGDIVKNPKSMTVIDLLVTSKAFDWPPLNSGSSQTSTSLANNGRQAPAGQQASKSHSQYVFSDTTLPLNSLSQAQGKIVLSIDELGLPNRKPIQNLKATAQINGSTIDVPNLTFQLGQGQADLQFYASQLNRASPVFSLKGITKNFTLENLLARIDPHSKVTGGNMKMAFDLKGSGMSLHQIVGSSNGKIQISVDQAKTGSNFLNDGGDFVITVLDAMNPLRKKSSQTTLECAVAYLPITNGQISIVKTVGIETDRLNAVMAGSINLKTEAVDLIIDPQEKSGLTTGLDLAGLAKVGGTLTHPKAVINQAGVVNSAVSIGLGILTGGVSILAENARSISSKGHPCRDALHPWSDIYPGAE
ncbi:AsmA family protein [Polynucleobacter sp. CS-Odin-A6]|uniref:AsmA family protein n=1 Tax=Polynucleobacter sp. CS-Odin-A6 TaxID=2689106 RepID=UPI001C0ACF59|nr:AsmA family protein [Polynucleobacter sp. CS-Odin-A6]MBU3621747.1 AsmA family protein [Polynucleobacter sp. CS-Odin-A6]